MKIKTWKHIPNEDGTYTMRRERDGDWVELSEVRRIIKELQRPTEAEKVVEAVEKLTEHVDDSIEMTREHDGMVSISCGKVACEKRRHLRLDARKALTAAVQAKEEAEPEEFLTPGHPEDCGCKSCIEASIEMYPEAETESEGW